MTKLKMVRAAVAASTALVLSLGVVGIASANSNGGDSWWNNDENSVKSSVKNNNDVDVNNDNTQYAHTGEAKVKHNNDAGDAETGVASNANDTGIELDVANTNCGCDSEAARSLDVSEETNSMSVETSVENTNDVEVKNYNDQKAISGDASVKHNNDGGNATTGEATNTNSTTIKVSITN